MTPCIEIVKSVKNEIEAPEPVNVKWRIFNVGMMSLEFYVRIELAGVLFRNLPTMIRRIFPRGVNLLAHQSFTFLDVFMTE